MVQSRTAVCGKPYHINSLTATSGFLYASPQNQPWVNWWESCREILACTLPGKRDCCVQILRTTLIQAWKKSPPTTVGGKRENLCLWYMTECSGADLSFSSSFFPFFNICQFNSVHRAVCGIRPLYHSCWAFQSLDKWWCSFVGHWNEVRFGRFR